MCIWHPEFPLQWRHNEHDGVSNHQPRVCLLNRLLRRCRSKKTSKLRVTGLCEGNSPVTGEFPTQRASNGEMFPVDDVIILPIIYRKSWHFQHFDLLSKCQHISQFTATLPDYNSNQVHPDTQMRSGCVEMIYPCNNDLWWHNGVSRGGSRCCEYCGTHTGIYLWSLSCCIYYIMMTSSNGNIFRDTGPLRGNSPVTGEFSAQIPVTWSFDVFSDLRLNNRLSRQSWSWWFETPARS